VSTAHALQILCLEDDPNDSELLHEMLQANGLACELLRVDTQTGFEALLRQGGIDLILADYTLPSFDGLSALKLAMTLRPEVPFIFVTGTLGEEVAIEALKVGATDYVLKTRLSRLGPSVHRALRESGEVAERKRTEKALRRSEAYLAQAQRLSRTGSFGWNVTTAEHTWSDETYRIFEYDPGTAPTLELVLQRTHPEDRGKVRQVMDSAAAGAEGFDVEQRLVMDDASIKYVRVVAHLLPGDEPAGLLFVGAVTDVTETRLAEKALRRSEGYLTEAQRLTRTGSWAWSAASRQAIHWSQEHYRLFGFDPRSLL
jgi:CheY-like chemotaxis protein